MSVECLKARTMKKKDLNSGSKISIGPRSQPDFDHDMYLSPIVAPARLLAEFPPVLFICGEKDPICDDTVVMAGRIRQAKLAKQADLKRRGGRFGEQLRMSGTANGSSIEEIGNVDDWVQMRIIEGWSHGFMQVRFFFHLLPLVPSSDHSFFHSADVRAAG